jgi:hypothetical protein
MRLLPASRGNWLGLLLLPFKIFVPAGYLMVVLQRAILGYRHESNALTLFVLNGYLLTFLVLTIGAMIQHRSGARRAYYFTCGFIVASFVFSLLLLPYLAHV